MLRKYLEAYATKNDLILTHYSLVRKPKEFKQGDEFLAFRKKMSKTSKKKVTGIESHLFLRFIALTKNPPRGRIFCEFIAGGTKKTIVPNNYIIFRRPRNEEIMSFISGLADEIESLRNELRPKSKPRTVRPKKAKPPVKRVAKKKAPRSANARKKRVTTTRKGKK